MYNIGNLRDGSSMAAFDEKHGTLALILGKGEELVFNTDGNIMVDCCEIYP